MATSLHAELVGRYVETPASLRMSTSDRERLAQNLRLAEQLGAEAVDAARARTRAAETVRYARKRNVTKIVVGKPTHPRWRDLVRPSFLDEIVRQSGEIDVYVISGLPERERRGARAPSAGRALGEPGRPATSRRVGRRHVARCSRGRSSGARSSPTSS